MILRIGYRPKLPVLWGLIFFAGVLPLASAAFERVANTTIRMPTNLRSAGYTTVEAFPGLELKEVVAIASPPGETNRLFFVQQTGTIYVVTNLASPDRSVFLDLSGTVLVGGEAGVLGLAFHPNFQNNGQFFVFYTLNTTTLNLDGTVNDGMHDQVSRFTVMSDDPNRAAPDSEVVLISQYDHAVNHNAGDLHFGPDGYLYVSLGDEGGGGDTYGNSQRIDQDFFSGILRLDVDERPGSLLPNPHGASIGSYRIPPDNPFVGATRFNDREFDPEQVRTEFWAVGLRNPWRFSFDPVIGTLWCGDVGQNGREEVNQIVRGGNYGWNYFEGSLPYFGIPPIDFQAIGPVVEYGRSGATSDPEHEGSCIIGGVVYRGMGLPELSGRYIFGDMGSGFIWALQHDGVRPTEFTRLLTDEHLYCFGIDPRNGDVLLSSRTIVRLVHGEVSEAPPTTLAETGVFADVATLTPAPGVEPYDVNVPLWSDHAMKQRWFSVPDLRQKIRFQPEGPWDFPSGSVWIKHFDLELTNGVPESRRRLETRLLVRDDSSIGVYGVTYRWGESLTDATLVPDVGMDETLTINEGGELRTQVWHYPGRNECLACHTAQAQGVLGFNTRQLNRDFRYGDVTDNQLHALSEAGYFTEPISNRHSLARVTPWSDETASLDHRVRSYVSANCSQCHQPGGSAPALFDARVETPLSAAGWINGPIFNPRGDSANRVIVPGSLDHSMLLARLSTRGAGQMPPLASSIADPQAEQLVSRWITNDLLDAPSFAAWQSNFFGSTNSVIASVDADPDGDADRNGLEWLVGTDPMDDRSNWRIQIARRDDTVVISYLRAANRGFEVQWSSDLTDGASWKFLDVPENRPFLSATSDLVVVPDRVAPQTTKFYRVRVFEP